MFTLIAFSESQDPGGVFAKVAAVSDQHVRTSGDKITVPQLNNIIASYGINGTGLGEARLVSPTLRRVNPYYITPTEITIAPASDPRIMYHGDNPIPLETNEDLEVENSANPAGAEVQTYGVWLADGPQLPVTGEIVTVNCEITLALVASSWEFSEITFPDSLPVADYDIVGARLVAAAGTLFRFVPVGASNRPGGVCAVATDSLDPFMQRYGRLGAWLTFNTVQPPGVEVLASAAAGSATYQLYLDLIKKS